MKIYCGTIIVLLMCPGLADKPGFGKPNIFIMIPDTYSPHEQKRLAALEKAGIMDSLPEKEFDDIVLLASKICKAPVSLISLVDEKRQWFKAKVGIEMVQTAREISFCTHAIMDDKVMIVEDALLDEHFYNNPLVKGEPYIRFYAGFPIISGDGYRLGALCVIDYVPRKLNGDQLFTVKVLARHVGKMIELKQRNRELESLNNVLQRISSITAHDIRGPIRTLQTIVSMITEGYVSQNELETMLPMAEAQLENTLRLLNNLVEWGKIQVGNGRNVKAEFLLYEPVAACIEENKFNAALKSNAIINNVKKSITINSDENAFRFIIRNLLNNAIKFTSNGIITVDYSRYKKYHVIAVRDTGIGMETDNKIESENGMVKYRKRLGTDMEKGSGLGLLLVNEQLTKMNGFFEIESARGVGTVVRVFLPL